MVGMNESWKQYMMIEVRMVENEEEWVVSQKSGVEEM